MDKWQELKARMDKLAIYESDILEKFILSSGRGGQKINKSSSAVYLKHIPTSIEVKCQKTRSQDLNRLYARRELCEKVESQIFNLQTKKQSKIEKIRKQKSRRSRRTKQKISESKDLHLNN